MPDDPVERFVQKNVFAWVAERVRAMEVWVSDQAYRIEVLKN
jgi:hypothetical protein